LCLRSLSKMCRNLNSKVFQEELKRRFHP
jgi:hypothetical protein